MANTEQIDSAFDSASPASPPYTVVNPGIGVDFSEFKGGNILFELLPDIHARQWENGYPPANEDVASSTPWHAIMTLHTKDVSKAMMDGIDLSHKVMGLGADYISSHQTHLSPYRQSIGWKWWRQIALQDPGDNPQWRGYMVIFAGRLEELGQFRIENLSAKNVRFADARKDSAWLYHFDSARADENFNLHFMGMPPKKWWPRSWFTARRGNQWRNILSDFDRGNNNLLWEYPDEGEDEDEDDDERPLQAFRFNLYPCLSGSRLRDMEQLLGQVSWAI